MSATPRRAEAETYTPTVSEQGQLLDLVQALEARGEHVASPETAIVTSDGTRHPLTPAIADVLARAARALADGQGVTVMPRHRQLTTQEAADLLNISRPTLVKLLETGDIPYEMRGRHRRIRLDDVLEYQDRMSSRRHETLQGIRQEAEDAGLYDLLDGPPPATR
jgi:excisionase family DNA binding protein